MLASILGSPAPFAVAGLCLGALIGFILGHACAEEDRLAQASLTRKGAKNG
jgi:surfactin synthase thioesterase subunit